MAAVTISREFGSEGSAIAQQVAQALGYKFVDKNVIGQVLIQYGFVEFKHEYESVPGFWATFDSRRTEMVGMLDRVMQALARHGNVVILGRGSFAVLGGFADVLNIRLKAPFPLRVKRVMDRENIVSVDLAEARVEENDKIRTAFIERFYTVPWDTTRAFDMVLDTGKVSPVLASAWLVDIVKAMSQTKTGDERTTRVLSIDPVLAAVVAETLAGQVVAAVLR
jgi:cytidylate kinase